MGRIFVRNLNVYAYHGCFLEERKIGSEYRLDIWVEGDFSSPESSDDLMDTIDYVAISDIAAKEMSTPSNLIEHVADQILSQILLKWTQIKLAGLVIKKLAPPMNVYAESVEYTLERTR